MNISNTRATFGLNAKATPANDNVSGTVQVGDNNETVALSDATKIITFDAVIVGNTSDLVIDVSDLDSTGSTAWTAGTAQVETATAAGTITGSGNATVTVTASGMTGSPKAISVAVTNGDTAATWAGKVRTALAADADVSALFTVGGSTTAISLTRKSLAAYTVKGSAVGVFPADDATLNIALDNGTCTGITTASTSANTTAGVATAGTYAPELDGNDFEGNATGGSSTIEAIYIKNSADSAGYITVTSNTEIADYLMNAGAILMTARDGGVNISDVTIEPEQSALVTVTIAAS